MRRAAALLALALLAGCSGPPPRDHADKETYIEAPPPKPPCEKCGRAYDHDESSDPLVLALRLRFKYPLDVVEVDRGYCIARAINPSSDRRVQNQAVLIDASQEEAMDGSAKPSATAPKEERPPALLWFPDRSDLRDTSACYLGHVAFFQQTGMLAETRPIHHLRLRVVNREALTMEVGLRTFLLSSDLSDPNAAPIPFMAATNDRGVEIEKLVLTPGSEETAHLFFHEQSGLSPVLSAAWTVRLTATDGEVEERSYGAKIIRRYVAREAPLTPLEDAISRGQPLLQLSNPSGPWVDPGLQGIAGSGGR